MPQDAHFALVVGINKYPALTPLRGPKNDAADVFQWLTAADGGDLPPGNIEWLQIDEAKFETPDAAEPTRKIINDALGRVIAKARALVKQNPLLWKRSRLYVYFSGHGIAPNAREVALLTADVKPDQLGESIPCSMYMAHLQDAQLFRELVFFADCCRTTRIQAQLAGPPFNFERGNWGQVSTVLGFATGFGDLAYEPTPDQVADPDSTRGFFTKALLEALRGEAIDAEVGPINITNVAKYVRERVLELTGNRPAPQEPVLLANPALPIVFRPPAPRRKKKVRIQFAAGIAGEAVLLDGENMEVDGSPKRLDTHQCANGLWEIALPNGMYEVSVSGQLNGVPFVKSELFKVLGEDKDVHVA